MPIILATRRLTNSKLPRLTHSESLWKDERRREGRNEKRGGGKETRNNNNKKNPSN